MNNDEQQNITSDTFFNLYRKTSKDENVVKINDAPGITIVRKYDEDTEYFKDDKRMFIKFYIVDGEYVAGGVNMVKKREEGTYTIIEDKKQYKKHFTNFLFWREENVVFKKENNKFLISKGHKVYEFNVNDFVDLLVKNHLSDRLFFRRKINKIKILFLRVLFWFMDSRYNWVDYYHKIHKNNRLVTETNREETVELNKLKIEPFFKYFQIYRKILFTFIVVSAGIMVFIFMGVDTNAKDSNFYNLFKAENFSISNPILLFLFFIALFVLHYFSLFLQRKVSDKEGFIYKLHNSSLNNSFSMKIFNKRKFKK